MDYPSTLPAPNKVGYSGTDDHGLLQTNLDTVQGNQIATFNAPSQSVSMSFNMTNSVYKTWIAWVADNAWKWFDMDLITPNTPVNITSKQTVRFAGDIAYTKNGHNWVNITVAAELLPAQLADPAA